MISIEGTFPPPRWGRVRVGVDSGVEPSVRVHLTPNPSPSRGGASCYELEMDQDR
jgi:hypothetical protein